MVTYDDFLLVECNKADFIEGLMMVAVGTQGIPSAEILYKDVVDSLSDIFHHGKLYRRKSGEICVRFRTDPHSIKYYDYFPNGLVVDWEDKQIMINPYVEDIEASNSLMDKYIKKVQRQKKMDEKEAAKSPWIKHIEHWVKKEFDECYLDLARYQLEKYWGIRSSLWHVQGVKKLSTPAYKLIEGYRKLNETLNKKFILENGKVENELEYRQYKEMLDLQKRKSEYKLLEETITAIADGKSGYREAKGFSFYIFPNTESLDKYDGKCREIYEMDNKKEEYYRSHNRWYDRNPDIYPWKQREKDVNYCMSQMKKVKIEYAPLENDVKYVDEVMQLTINKYDAICGFLQSDGVYAEWGRRIGILPSLRRRK